MVRVSKNLSYAEVYYNYRTLMDFLFEHTGTTWRISLMRENMVASLKLIAENGFKRNVTLSDWQAMENPNIVGERVNLVIDQYNKQYPKPEPEENDWII